MGIFSKITKAIAPEYSANELATKVKRVFTKWSIYSEGEPNRFVKELTDALTLWFIKFPSIKGAEDNTVKLVNLINGIYGGSIKCDRAALDEMKRLINFYHAQGFTFAPKLYPWIDRILMGKPTPDDLEKLTYWFSRSHEFDGMDPVSQWWISVDVSRAANMDAIYDPGTVIYKIVESYRYFDIVNASKIYAGVRPLTGTKRAVCMYDLCRARFKIDERVADLIRNDAGTRDELKNTIGFYCCDDHALKDRKIGEDELTNIVRIAAMAWTTKQWKTVKRDQGPEYCVVWHGDLVPSSVFVASITDFSETFQSFSTLWWISRLTPYAILPRLSAILLDLEKECIIQK
jgi:hypothetical protein